MGDPVGKVDSSASNLTRRGVSRTEEPNYRTSDVGSVGGEETVPAREEADPSPDTPPTPDPASGRRGSQEGASSRSRRSRRRRQWAGGLSWPLLLGSLISLAVSGLLGWQLLRPAGPPLQIDPAEIAAVLSDTLVAQSGAVNALVRHLRHAQSSGARRVDFLALGPAGTGKTLLTQALASLPRSVTARRLVGDVEITRDRAGLDRAAAQLVTAAPAGGWLLLALDDVKSHLPESVYLVEAVGAAAAAGDVRLITLVTATTSDLAGERGAEATREAFARHSHVLPFRPLRRSAVVACLQRYARGRGLALPEETAQAVARAVKFDGQYAVNGCKPAIYHLQAALNLKDS